MLSDRNEKTLAGNAVRRGKAAGIGRALGVEAILSRHLEIRLGFDCVHLVVGTLPASQDRTAGSSLIHH